mmetsp:Transcript_44594/g.72592  ORF Transcript_44594/g.72592 Transcript_44594/m.72592 type:complete len:261 (+) Transcript_44594:1453-2235(+)
MSSICFCNLLTASNATAVGPASLFAAEVSVSAIRFSSPSIFFALSVSVFLFPSSACASRFSIPSILFPVSLSICATFFSTTVPIFPIFFAFSSTTRALFPRSSTFFSKSCIFFAFSPPKDSALSVFFCTASACCSISRTSFRSASKVSRTYSNPSTSWARSQTVFSTLTTFSAVARTVSKSLRNSVKSFLSASVESFTTLSSCSFTRISSDDCCLLIPSSSSLNRGSRSLSAPWSSRTISFSFSRSSNMPSTSLSTSIFE